MRASLPLGSGRHDHWILVTIALVIAALLLALAPRSAAAFAYLSYGWSFPDSSRITINWMMHEDPQTPIVAPSWAGWDILRRSLNDCGAPARINLETFPRDSGNTHSYSFTDEPTPGAYRYQIVPVNAEHGTTSISQLVCDGCNFGDFSVAVPDNSAPVIVGTLGDGGWAIGVSPCAGSCFEPVYFEGPFVNELRPYADGKTAVRLYGYIGCCSTEGPSMQVDRYVIAPCLDIVPVTRATWGRVKAIYR